jgi:hypothetical protein
MRTTIAIDDELLKASKVRARTLGLTLGQLVEEALRRQLSSGGQDGPRPPVPVFRGGSGPRPGVDLTSNRAVLELLDEDKALGELR